MGELLTRRRGLILPSGGGPTPSGPLYPLDGTYKPTGAVSLTITNNSHWVLTGSGAINNALIYAYPKDLFQNKAINYSAEVSNFTIISGNGNSKYIRFGTPGSPDWFNLFSLADGEGTFTQEKKLTSSYQNLIRLHLNFGWSSGFGFEFDFKFYADGVWIS